MSYMHMVYVSELSIKAHESSNARYDLATNFSVIITF